MLTHAATLGVTLWDTADAYCKDEDDMGYGDYLCQKAFAALPTELRERTIITIKGGTVRPDNRLWQLHAPDGKTPSADSIGAIAEAKQQGKIHLVGLSNVSAAQIEEAAANLVFAR